MADYASIVKYVRSLTADLERVDFKMNKLSHIDENSNAVMVDVSNKEITHRTAKATGKIYMSKVCFDIVKNGKNKKGDVLTVAQVAGIMAAKKTSDLIPLCHPLMIDKISLTFEEFTEENKQGFVAYSEVSLNGKTGVEMEALTAVHIGLLTIYDMCKAVDKRMVINDIHLLTKSGGKSGDFSF